jgi:hypothetical protein
MSWIAHDSALEGVGLHDSRAARRRSAGSTFAFDSSMQPVVEEIRRHREALNFIREYADQAAQPHHGRRGQEDLLRPSPRRGGRQDGQVPQGHPPAPPLLPRVRAARQDRLQAAADRRLDQRSGDARTRTPVRIAARAHYDILRVFPVRHRQRQGRAPRHEPAAAAQRIPAGHHPLDRAAAVLRGAQGLERDDEFTIVQDAIENSLASIEKLLDTTARLYEPKPSSE